MTYCVTLVGSGWCHCQPGDLHICRRPRHQRLPALYPRGADPLKHSWNIELYNPCVMWCVCIRRRPCGTNNRRLSL